MFLLINLHIMEGYYEGIMNLIRKYHRIWLIIYPKSIALELTNDIIRYYYQDEKWNEKLYYPHNNLTPVNIYNSKVSDHKLIRMEYLMTYELYEPLNIFYVGDRMKSPIDQSYIISPDKVLSEIQGCQERPKMITFWIVNLLIKYNK